MAKSCCKRLINTSGEIFLDTLQYQEKCCCCILRQLNGQVREYAQTICPYDNMKRTVGHRKVNKGEVYMCGSDYGKNQLFAYDLDCLSSSLKILAQTTGEIERYKGEEYNQRIRRVFHNVRTINAHSLQEIRALIPEYLLKQHKRKSYDEMEAWIEKHIPKTSSTLFNLAKDLYSVKSEFSVYDKLIKGNTELDKRPYNFRDIIMLVLYPFFEEFKKKNVYVDVQNCYDCVNIDFETFQIAVYHIVENASKYIMPNSDSNISFPKIERYQCIEFSMQSLHINKNESEYIFMENYSGAEAKLAKMSGDGIGMYRARKLIELNGGTIDVVAGDNIISLEGRKYSNNKFIIKFPI